MATRSLPQANPYFAGNVFDKALKALQALGENRNPTRADLQEARHQIIAQMRDRRRSKPSARSSRQGIGYKPQSRRP